MGVTFLSGLYGIRSESMRVVEHAWMLCLNAIISSKALDPFKSSLGMTQGGGPGTSALDTST